MVYYNENDKFAAAWLKNLIKAGQIADGEVDDRSIQEVRPDDLGGYTQHHFFAGIGGWSYALRLAGWPDDQPVWTGSCPCQPFSTAGKQKGFADSRHLWPDWNRLIREHRPVAIFGEQVATALGWLDLVSGDLENQGYAFGSAIMGAHSVGAPHIRQRIYWVADSTSAGLEGAAGPCVQRRSDGLTGGKPVSHVAHAAWATWLGTERCGDTGSDARGCGEVGVALGDTDESGSQRRQFGGHGSSKLPSWPTSLAGELGHTAQSGCETLIFEPFGDGPRSQRASEPSTQSFWDSADWLWCRDEKYRAVESGTFPLAHGVPARVGRLRGYGNAIVPQVAQAFIEAYMECCP